MDSGHSTAGFPRCSGLLCSARTMRRWQRTKVVTALSASAAPYAISAVCTLAPYSLLYDYSGIRQASVSSQFNYLSDMLLIRPFLTWTDSTAAGYLAAALVLGAVLTAVFSLLASLCGTPVRGPYSAALMLGVVYYWMFPQFYIEHFCSSTYEAAFLSALPLTGVNLTGYAIPFLAQGTLRFSACSLGGIWSWGTPWFDWSYGLYLLVLAALLLALSLGSAGLTLFLSQYSSSYIAMLLKAVPLFVAVGAVLGTWLMDSPFTFRPLGSGSFWVPQGAEAAVAAILLTMGIGLCVFSCMHQKKQLL